MADNTSDVLADVPTELYIGGKFLPAADRGRCLI
jgi:hypothetical protein